MTKVHALRNGSVRIKRSQMAGRGRGLARAGHVLIDPEWSGWVPIYAWLIEHDEGPILVDTGETARVHERGYHPRWHPFYRLASQFQVAPHDEIGPQLREMGIRAKDIRKVVITHLHTDHAGGLAHLVDRPTWLHPRELSRAKGIGGRVQGYLPHRWPKWWNPEPLRFESLSLGPFREAMRLTTRGDVLAVPTPGHTPGHVSVIVRGEPSIFIAGDTSYTEELLRQGVVDGVSPDEVVARETNQRILALAREQPLVYLPSHDPESADRLAHLATLTPVAYQATTA